MAPTLHTVSRGLSLTRVGVKMAGWGVGVGIVCVVVGFCCVFAALRPTDPTFLLVVGGGVVLSAFGVTAAGLVVGVVGRCICAVGTPPEAPAARATVRLSAVLEVCGWMNGLTTLGVKIAMIWNWFDLPDWTLAVGACFSLVLLLAARACFLHYCKRLAGYLDARVAFDLATIARNVLILATAFGVTAAGLIGLGSALARAGAVGALILTFGVVIAVAAAMASAYAPFVFAGLLRELTAAARRFDAAADGTPDESVSSEGESPVRQDD